eukprot:14910.XXX_1204562_1204813_1 [CDS] Oithona nana genome sequencing.
MAPISSQLTTLTSGSSCSSCESLSASAGHSDNGFFTCSNHSSSSVTFKATITCHKKAIMKSVFIFAKIRQIVLGSVLLLCLQL